MAAVIAVISVSVLVPATASADVGRANNAEVEIENYYREFLLRPSDPGGYAGFRDRMYGDCKFGILSAGMMIGDSGEAHGRLRTPSTFVPAMYRALLNRNVDPGGLRTYTNVINTRGYRWAISDVQASPEFRNRLNAVCNGRRGSVTQNEVSANEAISRAIEINDAGMDLIKTCGVVSVISLAGGLHAQSLYQASKAIRAAKRGMEAAVGKGAVGACLSAYQVLKIADEVAATANYEPGLNKVGLNNPTYIYLDQTTDWAWNGRFCNVQMGAGASADVRSWREIRFRC